ncbi:MAG: AAA family ATPase [Flavobacterium sp.]
MKNYDLLFSNDNKPEINNVIKDYFLAEDDEPIKYFPNFSTINIIVGANNSGKSRFMRYLMAYKSFVGINSFENTTQSFAMYNSKVDEIGERITQNVRTYNESSARANYQSIVNENNKKINDIKAHQLVKIKVDSDDALKTIGENKTKLLHLQSYGIEENFVLNFDIDKEYLKRFQNIKRYYIPTLRTAHSLFQFQDESEYKKFEQDIFLETLNKYYGLDAIDVEVFTGIHLYKNILNSRNAKREIRERFEKFEDFIKVNFFSGKKIDIVAEFDKDESLKGNNNREIISVHIEGENETRYLHELGDGIQAIIILMYKIFMAEPNSFIFIDEPELNLHPGMQRLFLDQVCKNPDLKKKNLTYIISTHSNHFLDLTIEKENVSIYSFSPKSLDNGDKQFVIKNVNSGDNQLLKDLGVNNSSVFMANCSIWVEGISDRNYIKAFLKSYTDHLFKNDKKNYVNLKEDIDFAFFEYAGSNIDHYVFDKDLEKDNSELILEDIKALALSNRIFLLADSDMATAASKKGIRLKALEDSKTHNFVPYIIRNIREVENLLTNDIWKEVLLGFCNKTLLPLNEEIINKKINEALAKINSSKYSKKYAGQFLDVIRTEIGKISGKYIVNQSTYEVNGSSFGTIINKRELSETVYSKNFSWDILSKNPEIENLTIAIYNFITNR